MDSPCQEHRGQEKAWRAQVAQKGPETPRPRLLPHPGTSQGQENPGTPPAPSHVPRVAGPPAMQQTPSGRPCSLPLRRREQSGGIRLGNLEQDPHWVELMVWGLNLGHLNQSDAQGPDVGFVVIRGVLHGLTHHHLRGHPEPTKGQQRAKNLASTGTSQRLRVSDHHKPMSEGWRHSRIMMCMRVHPTVFLTMVFTQKDAFRGAPPPRPAAGPTPATRWQQQSRTQSPGEGAGGGRGEGARTNWGTRRVQTEYNSTERRDGREQEKEE